MKKIFISAAVFALSLVVVGQGCVGDVGGPTGVNESGLPLQIDETVRTELLEARDAVSAALYGQTEGMDTDIYDQVEVGRDELEEAIDELENAMEERTLTDDQIQAYVDLKAAKAKLDAALILAYQEARPTGQQFQELVRDTLQQIEDSLEKFGIR